MPHTPTYDFRLKMDAVNGTLPDELIKLIDRRTIANWRRIDWNTFVGYEYYNKREKDTSVLYNEIQTLKKSLKELQAKDDFLTLINQTVSEGNEYGRLIYKNRKEIMNCVEGKKEVLSVKKCSKLININSKTYYEWRAMERAECEFSRKFTCIKRYPHQLSMDEELKIIQLLQDPAYENYPLSSLYWKAHYEGIVHASINTWRKLQKQYKIIRLKPKKQKKPHYKSLKSYYPNQYLHADITYFKLQSGKTYYIYIVKDNYSKYITSWAISDTVNPDTRIKTFQDSIEKIDMHENLKVSFVTDKGVENKNNKVKDFFSGFENIDLKIARMDIPYSNSMIERYNYDLKYMYLYREYVYTLKQLTNIVEMAVHEHNYTKRMECLKGQTPFEVYNGIPSRNNQIKEQWNQAKKNRTEIVKNTICCTS